MKKKDCWFLNLCGFSTESFLAIWPSQCKFLVKKCVMALISTEENTEFEVPKSFVSCLGSTETATRLYL